MLKGLRKGPPDTWSRSRKPGIEGNHIPFGDLALEKGTAPRFEQGSRCHPVCLLSSWSKPVTLTSRCKDPPEQLMHETGGAI